MALQKEFNPRHLAWDILYQTDKQDNWLEDRLDQRLAKSQMDIRDQRLCRELCFGVTKMRIYLDYMLDHFLKNPEKTEGKIRLVLRMGAYQLLCLDKIPKHAAVHETVELAKQVLSTGQVKVVNAILRNLTRQPMPALPDIVKAPCHYLQVRYSFPEYIAARWLKRFGLENTEKMMQQANAVPSLTARVNAIMGSAAQAMIRLHEQEIECESGKCPSAIVIHPHASSPAVLLENNPQWFYYQDQASQLVGWLINPPEQGICLDLCAAPGGKTTHVAELLGNQGCVQAYDISERKRKKISQNAERLGLRNITLLTDLTSVLSADRVWVDAPCSGLGTLRRHVETRWRIEEKDHQRLSETQRALLQQAMAFVKPGGHLIYITCTTEPEENEEVVYDFLEKNPQFILVPGPGRENTPGNEYWSADGFFRTFPNFSGMDAMFAARLVHQISG